MNHSVRRIVTGHDADGKAVVLSDEPAPNQKVRSVTGLVSTLVWATDETPAKLDLNIDRADRTIGVPPPQNGTLLRVVDFPPVDKNVEGISQADILIISTVIIVMSTFAFFFQRTSLGLSLRAAAFQPEISRLAGVKVDRVRTIGWALSGAAGAIVGVLVTPGSYLNPFSLDILLVYGFVAAVIGGLESPQGAALGGLILGMSLSFTSIYVSSGLTFIVPFVVLLLILIVKPKGIFGGGSSRNA